MSTFSEKLKKTLIQYNIKWNLLRCITTNDGKNMCGTEKGSVGQIHKVCEKIRYLKPMVVNCLIYEQRLCRKYLNLSCVIETEVSTAYFICFHGFIHLQFHEFLSEIEAGFLTLPYYTVL